MGNNATVLIRTDAVGEIRSNAQQFVDNMLLAINAVAAGAAPKDFPVANHGNPAQVINFHHADNTSILAVGANCGREIGLIHRWFRHNDAQDRELALEIIRSLMARHKISIQLLKEFTA